jgi:phosphatidate cytidylyltransferase
MRRRFSISSLAHPPQLPLGIVLKRAPVLIDNKKMEEAVSRKSIWRTMWTRSVFGVFMICAMTLILLSGPLTIILSVAMMQTLVFKEVISIAHLKSKEKKLPWFRSINWYKHTAYF